MKFIFALASICILITINSNGQTIVKIYENSKLRPSLIPEVNQLDTNDTIEVNPSVKYGKLDNGLTYYIVNTKAPKNVVYLRLIVKAGYLNEDHDQRGIPHLLEHAAFRGLKHFPGDSLDKYLASVGVVKGTNYTASTGYSSTEYRLGLPNKLEILENGFKILRDWAQGGMLLTNEGIDSERKIVIEEFRTRSSPRWEAYVNSMAAIISPSRYSDIMRSSRDEEARNIISAKYESVRRFYKDWYRPDLEGLIVVGDIELQEIEQIIAKLFSDLEMPTEVQKALDYKPNVSNEGRFIINTHSQNNAFPYAEINVYSKFPGGAKITYGDFKTSVIGQIYNEIVRERIEDLQYNNSFTRILNLYKDQLFQGPARKINGLRLTVDFDKTNIGNIEQGFKALYLHLESIKRFGFSTTEFKDAVRKLRNSYESLDFENPKKQIIDLVDHFTFGDAAPSPRYKKQLFLRIINEVTLKEVNDMAQTWIGDEKYDISIIAPEEIKTHLPNKTDIYNWISEVRSSKIKPQAKQSQVSVNFDSIYKLPTQDQYKMNKIQEIDAIELTLSNGLKVIVKTSSSNKVYFEGFSQGGISQYQGDEYFSAAKAIAVLKQSGIGELDKNQLREYLLDNHLIVKPYITNRFEGIKGSSPTENFELLMQVIYRYFTSPSKDSIRCENFIDRQIELADKRDHTLSKTLADILYLGEGNLNHFSHEDWKKVKSDHCFNIYKERFSNAGDFTFLIFGVPDINSSIPIINKYLGALPDNGVREISEDWHLPRFKAFKEIVHNDNLNNEANVQMIFSSSYKYSIATNIKLDLLAVLLDLILSKRIIEQEGGSYTLSANAHYLKYIDNSIKGKGAYKQTTVFKCAPSKASSLISIALDEIKDLKFRGIDAETFEHIISMYRKSRQKTNHNSIAFSFDSLVKKYKEPKRVDKYSTKDVDAVLNRLTAKDIQKAAKKYLSERFLIQFIELSPPRT